VRRGKLKIGDVFTIPLDTERVGFGQAVDLFERKCFLLVVFTAIAPVSDAIDVEGIASSADLSLIGSSFDAKVHVGDWTVVGNTTPRPGLPRPAYKEVVGTPDRVDVVDFSGSMRRIATSVEIQLLTFRSMVAPVRLENALKALHGLAEWHDEYDKLLPENVVSSARVFV